MLQTTMQLNEVIDYLNEHVSPPLAKLISDYRHHYGVARIYKNDLHNILVGWFGAAQAEREMKLLECSVIQRIPAEA